LTTKTQARAPARALVGAAAFGSLAGLAIGCAYLGGETARATMIQAKAERFAGAAKSGYSEQSLAVAAGGVDRDALAIARRHDPSANPGGQSVLLATQAAPQQPDSASVGLRTANFRALTPASPFHMAGALDASRDLQCLTEAVYWEARGEGAAGMAAVAQVVLNRVRHPAFPKTVCGVVYQGASDGDCQFSFACKAHSSPSEDDAWERARQIASRALSGHVMTAVGQATNFHAVSVTPGWMTSLQKVAQIGSHIFYRFGHAGQQHDFRYAAEPSTQTTTPQPVLASLGPIFGSAAAQPKPATDPVEKAAPQADPGTAPAPQPAAAGARVVDALPTSGTH
jgi:spore germination cell wall hydrolase CwlJ-like protein